MPLTSTLTLHPPFKKSGYGPDMYCGPEYNSLFWAVKGLSRRQMTTMRSNDTLGNTPFQLISDFFMLIKVFSVLSMLSKRQ